MRCLSSCLTNRCTVRLDCDASRPSTTFPVKASPHLDAGVPLLLLRGQCVYAGQSLCANIYSAFATLAMGLENSGKEKCGCEYPCSATAASSKRRAWPRCLAAAAGAPDPAWKQPVRAVPTAWPCWLRRLHRADGETLAAYLNRCVFADAQNDPCPQTPAEQSGFAALTQYQTALKAERAGIK